MPVSSAGVFEGGVGKSGRAASEAGLIGFGRSWERRRHAGRRGNSPQHRLLGVPFRAQPRDHGRTTWEISWELVAVIPLVCG
ncbi:MAG: hypothetical protein JO362_19745 [Streptomycetaceae bacterium]|nr:hypothetical protein [Streptomycetaceae bacterium]